MHLGATSQLLVKNNDIALIERGAFNGLTALTELDLSGNRLTAIPSWLFMPLSALTTLSWANNSVAEVEAGALSYSTFLTAATMVNNTLWCPLETSWFQAHFNFAECTCTGAYQPRLVKDAAGRTQSAACEPTPPVPRPVRVPAPPHGAAVSVLAAANRAAPAPHSSQAAAAALGGAVAALVCAAGLLCAAVRTRRWPRSATSTLAP